jgi:hypothetical protein
MKKPPLRGGFFRITLPNLAAIRGGGGGIRTHGHLRDNGFQDRYHRPLGHPSVSVNQAMLALGWIVVGANLALEYLELSPDGRTSSNSLIASPCIR